MSINKLERLLGYLTLDGEEFPFEFNEDDFCIVLYPSTKERWSELASPNVFLKIWIKE